MGSDGSPAVVAAGGLGEGAGRGPGGAGARRVLVALGRAGAHPGGLGLGGGAQPAAEMIEPPSAGGYFLGLLVMVLGVVAPLGYGMFRHRRSPLKFQR